MFCTCIERSNTASFLSAPDWYVDDDTNYNTNFTLNNLTGGGCYCVRFWLMDENQNVYAETSDMVCLNDEECINNPEPVQVLEASCESVCFTPSIYIDNAGVEHCATAYRLEVTDQEGNVRFIFRNDFPKTCEEEDVFCFTNEEIEAIVDDLGRPPYVGHIRTHYQESEGADDFTTNSNLFELEYCCDQNDFEDPEIIHDFRGCNVEYQFLHFCIDNLPGCILDEEGEVNIINTSVEAYFPAEVYQNKTGNNCFTVKFFTNKSNICLSFHYRVTITYTNVYGDIMTHTINGNFPYCCTITDPPVATPPRSIAIESVYIDSEEGVTVRGNVPELEVEINESRNNHIPVLYTLINKQSDEFVEVKEYSSQIYLNIPETNYNQSIYNEKYRLYLLANNEIYELEFPSYASTNQRSFEGEQSESKGELFVYPNPANDFVLLNYDKHKIIRVKIYDQRGILYSNIDYSDHKVKLSLQDLPNGFYYLHVEDESGGKHVKKLIHLR